MSKPDSANRHTAFAAGLQVSVEQKIAEIQEVYLADEIPWVVGYSGGKDSTAVLQLVWLALQALPSEQLRKPVHVISTDTLVENPVVAAWVVRSLESIRASASEGGLPIQAHRLTPRVEDTFWVNLIGKGYPAPRPKFRWCTLRLKITPSNTFISDVVRENGEAILVLGTRRAESAKRAANMKKHAAGRTRDLLSPNASLPNSLVYSPIEDWTNDDVWLFLMQIRNPWDYDNKALLTMYQGASEDGECPLVVDTTTPSCGDSRFGCWVCTLVDKDRSMSAMIQNDQEKEWMLPLLSLRDELAVFGDAERKLRDFRRMNGGLTLHNGRLVHGPYTQEVRARWLRRVLEAQQHLRTNGPPHMKNLELVTLAELEEIRRIWVVDKHEIEDLLPGIYDETVGTKYPGADLDDHLAFGPNEMQALKEVVGDDMAHYELVRNLLDTEQRFASMARRKGLFPELERVLKANFFASAEDALDYSLRKQHAKSARGDAPLAPGGAQAQDIDADTSPLGFSS